MKTRFEGQPSHSPIPNVGSGMSSDTLKSGGATYQTSQAANQQARPPQSQAQPVQQQVKAPQQQDRRSAQPTIYPPLQGPAFSQPSRLPYQQGQMPQQKSASFGPSRNQPPPMTMNNPNTSSNFSNTPGHQSRRTGNRYQPNPGPIPQGQFDRPEPQNRHLYQPGVNSPSGPLGPPQQLHTPSYNRLSPLAVQAQVDFLNQRAEVEIAEAEMDMEDLQEKENLRGLLQRVCRSAIRDYEQQKSRLFDESSVLLQSFGSLRSGFAIRGSDMDLTLVSPFSNPDIGSPDSDIPRLLEKVLLSLGYGARLLTRTRVPIIKFCEKPTPELTDALWEARVEWEEERDAPPKPIVAEQQKAKQESSQKKLDEISKQKALEGGTVTIHGKVIEQRPGSAISQTHIVPGQSAAETPIGEGSATEINAKANNKSKVRAKHHKTHLISPPRGQEGRGKGQGKSEDQESGEEELPQRSDEELVRLFQLAISEGWFNEQERILITQFASAVERHGSDGDHTELVDIRLRLETLSHVLRRYRAPPDTRLNFPKNGIGIQCDINFSNHLALHNTLLLRCYNHCDTRVRSAVLFVKAWAKRRKINSPYHGTLSSYGYVLMVLHYLINIAHPRLAPNLQMAWKPPVRGSPTLHETIVDGYDVRFWRSEEEIIELAHRGMLNKNRETVGSLLRGFFNYFAHNGPTVPHNGFVWTHAVLSLRTQGGLLSKQEKGWTGAKTTVIEPTAPGQQGREVKHRYLFAIEDPFEIDHNIARTVVHDGIVAIRDEFRRAHRIIQSAGRTEPGPLEDLFAESQQRKTRPWRAFGPLPPPIKADGGPPGPAKEEAPTARGRSDRTVG